MLLREILLKSVLLELSRDSYSFFVTGDNLFFKSPVAKNQYKVSEGSLRGTLLQKSSPQKHYFT